jgi:hypothetical protein
VAIGLRPTAHDAGSSIIFTSSIHNAFAPPYCTCVQTPYCDHRIMIAFAIQQIQHIAGLLKGDVYRFFKPSFIIYNEYFKKFDL